MTAWQRSQEMLARDERASALRGEFSTLKRKGSMITSTTHRVKQVEPDSKYVKERYLLANGAHEVVLVDQTEATWEAYCADIRQKAVKPDQTKKYTILHWEPIGDRSKGEFIWINKRQTWGTFDTIQEAEAFGDDWGVIRVVENKPQFGGGN